MKFVDLGKKPSNEMKPIKDGPYYPSVHLTGIKSDFSVGDEVILKCKVKRATEEDDGSYSCDLEARQVGVNPDDGEEGLDGALKKISRKKMVEDEDEDDE